MSKTGTYLDTHKNTTTIIQELRRVRDLFVHKVATAKNRSFFKTLKDFSLAILIDCLKRGVWFFPSSKHSIKVCLPFDVGQ